MKRFLLMCFSAISFFTYTSVHAQTYPCSGAGAGEVVVGQTGASNGIASVPLCQHAGNSDASSSPSQPQSHWKSRWGAIATDEPHGALGFSSGIKSGSSAEKAAINDCKAKGGVNCTVQVSYSNACGAVVVGDTVFNANWGNSVQEAVKKGIDMCNKASTNCHAYFTTCSPPVLVD